MAFLSSCFHPHWTDAGPVIQQVRTVAVFSSLSSYGSCDIFITQDSSYLLKAEGPERRLGHLTTTVSNARLRIEETGNSYWYSSTPKVYISQQLFDELYFSGSGDFSSNGILCSVNTVKNYGSGDVNLNLWGNLLNVYNNGSGDYYLDGTIGFVRYDLHGSGDVHAEDMITTRADVEMSGSGDVYISVSDTLHAVLNGSGDLYYKGTPAYVNIQTNGSGNVIHVN